MKNKQRIVHMLGKNRKCEFLRKNNHCCGSLRPLMQHMHGVISTCKALKNREESIFSSLITLSRLQIKGFCMTLREGMLQPFINCTPIKCL